MHKLHNLNCCNLPAPDLQVGCVRPIAPISYSILIFITLLKVLWPKSGCRCRHWSEESSHHEGHMFFAKVVDSLISASKECSKASRWLFTLPRSTNPTRIPSCLSYTRSSLMYNSFHACLTLMLLVTIDPKIFTGRSPLEILSLHVVALFSSQNTSR